MIHNAYIVCGVRPVHEIRAASLNSESILQHVSGYTFNQIYISDAKNISRQQMGNIVQRI